MKYLRLLVLILSMAILAGAFSNCSKIGFFNLSSVADKVTTTETVVGNPLTTSTKTLLSQICQTISNCHTLSSTDCESGVLNAPGIDYQLGLTKGSVTTFSEIVKSESSGLLSSNKTALDSCVADIQSLSCTDEQVQNAYDANSNSFAGLAFMIPTSAGSCPWIFNQPSARNEYYVAKTGSDLNDGSKDLPWASIEHAAQNLALGAEGAIVHVAPGEYTLTAKSNCGNSGSSCGVNTARSGSAQAPIIYISDSKWKAKLVAPSASSIWYNKGDYVKIIGFDLQGTTANNMGIYSEAAFGQMIGNHIHDIPVAIGCTSGRYGGGIYFGYDSRAHDNDAIGNWIHHIGPPSGMSDSQYCGNHALGVHYSQAGGNIINNILHHISGYAVSTGHLAHSLRISHNLLFTNGIVTTSNTMHGGAILISGDSQSFHRNTTVSNNILRNNLGHVLFEYDQVDNNNAYINNILFANKEDQFRLISTSTPTGTQITDPLMIDFKSDGTGNYSLTPGSPARDAASELCFSGTSECGVSEDFNGKSRSVGSNSDIGPLEWHP